MNLKFLLFIAFSLLIGKSYAQCPSISSNLQHLLCNGDSNGSIELTITNGTAPFAFNWSNGETTSTITGLIAGSYTITLTDNNACTVVESYTITEPGLLTTLPVVTDVDCNGNNNGQIQSVNSGGVAPYSFSWSNGETTGSISGLSPNTYTLTLTDANFCQLSITAIVQEPLALQFNSAITNISCNAGSNGAVDQIITGGISPYQFLWNTASTSEDLANLSAGIYDCTITDDNGCIIQSSSTVTEPGPLAVNSSNTMINCNGFNNGIIDLTTSGGITPYSFLWNNNETTEDISGLSAGSYQVTITDNNGCIILNSSSITEPTALQVSLNVTNITCFGANNGSVDLTVTGGTSPYSFLWSNSSTSEDISSLGPNTYNITVTDNNACTISDLTFFSEPALLAATSIADDVNCLGGTDGSIDLTIHGGTTPYQILWSNAMTSEDINNLVAGNFDVTITDANGCTATKSQLVNQPSTLMSATISSSHINCVDYTGEIQATTIGGTPGYSYLWSNTSTSSSISGLNTGIYQLTITDANGCTLIPNSIQINIGLPPVISTALVNNGPLCEGDQLTITAPAINGVSYAWTGPNGFIDSVQNISISNVSQMYHQGFYTLVVTDPSGCSSTPAVSFVRINQLPQLTIQRNNSPVDEKGTIEIIAPSLVGATYNWSGPNGFNSSQADVLIHDAMLSNSGNYTLTITLNNCSTTLTTQVEVIELPIKIYDYFTPNGDGANDTWTIQSVEKLTNYTIRVFSRAGLQVYYSENYANDWSGTNQATGEQLPDGTYFYIIKAEDKEYKGALTLKK